MCIKISIRHLKPRKIKIKRCNRNTAICHKITTKLLKVWKIKSCKKINNSINSNLIIEFNNMKIIFISFFSLQDDFKIKNVIQKVMPYFLKNKK